MTCHNWPYWSMLSLRFINANNLSYVSPEMPSSETKPFFDRVRAYMREEHVLAHGTTMAYLMQAWEQRRGYFNEGELHPLPSGVSGERDGYVTEGKPLLFTDDYESALEEALRKEAELDSTPLIATVHTKYWPNTSRFRTPGQVPGTYLVNNLSPGYYYCFPAIIPNGPDFRGVLFDQLGAQIFQVVFNNRYVCGEDVKRLIRRYQR